MVAEVAPAYPVTMPGRPGGPFRWSVGRYIAALEAGIFGPEDRLEMLDGELVQKMSQNPSHIVGLMLLTDALRAVFGQGFRVDSQIPLRTARSVPEPDVVVLRGSARDFAGRLPEPADVRLAAEVSDSSLNYDRMDKALLYAAAGVEEYWLLNVADRQLEVRRKPLPSGIYAEARVLSEVETVVLEGREIRVADLLP